MSPTAEPRRRYRFVLFDLDGTLTDSGPGITNSVKYALNKTNAAIPDLETLYRFVGPPLVDSFQRYCGFDADEARRAVAFYREYFAEKGLFENAPYPGVAETLEALKSRGKTLLVATSKPEVFAERILERFDLRRYFDFVCGATLDGSRSRKADVVRFALESANVVDGREAVLVGDTEFDAIGARENGIDALGVAYGFGAVDDLLGAGAFRVAATPAEIAEIIE